jgi:cytochrome c peroxidase
MIKRNTWLIGGFIFLLVSLVFLSYSCNNQKPDIQKPVKKFYREKTEKLILVLNQFKKAATQKADSLLLKYFSEARNLFKETETITEYYFQGLTRRINGPALPDIKTEDGQVFPPHGFQVLEQLIYEEMNDSLRSVLGNEIELLKSDLQFTVSNLDVMGITEAQVAEMLQHELIRIAALGISGFDAPVSKLSLPETIHALGGLEELASITNYISKKELSPLITQARAYIEKNNNFDDFDRLYFIDNHLRPIGKLLASIAHKGSELAYVKSFDGTFEDWLLGRGFNADAYSNYAVAASNKEKLQLGEKLFYDASLSGSGNISCASCHQPDKYFTDGLKTAGNLVHGGNLLRNTPGLFYSGLQAALFYDMRANTLEEQVGQVMRNSEEFNLSDQLVAQKLVRDTVYAPWFKKAFPGADSISSFMVRNAIASYVRSLAPFNSPFDEYWKGNRQALNTEQKNGFNLFMGKAKCGTCHFIPLFNGTVPPWHNKSESEIIGVPKTASWDRATIDPDEGRYNVNRFEELRFAFKTPTTRNTGPTAPYMHNGVYRTLEEVVKFYHKGGGAGIGMRLPFQTLPFDSLSLNQQEVKQIVSFLHSLTDKPKQ